jgi:hypothetical protein
VPAHTQTTTTPAIQASRRENLFLVLSVIAWNPSTPLRKTSYGAFSFRPHHDKLTGGLQVVNPAGARCIDGVNAL